MDSLLSICVQISYIVMSFSIFLCLIRLFKGPTLADRVVALDLISFISMALIALYAFDTDLPILLDVALILALVSFLSTVAFARYIFMRGKL